MSGVGITSKTIIYVISTTHTSTITYCTYLVMGDISNSLACEVA